ADHPPPAGLLQAFRDTFGDLRGFIDSRRIVTIPSPVPPIVEETPPFMRALTFASMDTPGPFEKQAKEAFFNVTLPEQAWTREQVEEHMVGFRMHTGDMTFEQAVEFFQKEGYQSHANALRETKRGTSDPTYLVYTLGKLQILKLRDDYRRKAGGSFRLQEFHDAFLRQGFPPVKIIRRAMLGDDGPTL